MNLVELSTFLSVVELKSLARAAERLNVTQSTVTARIDSLERRLGQKLLHRHKSGSELTSAGFKLVRYAEVVTQLWRQAQYEVGLPQGFTGVCNVGCYFDLWEGLVARFVDHVRRRRPDVAIAVWPGDQRSIDHWLDTGLVDLAFCYSPDARGSYAIRDIAVDELVRVEVAPPTGNGPEAPQPAYVYVDYGEQFRRDHAVTFAGEPPAAVTLASCRWAIDHLMRTGGSCYLPRRHVAELEATSFHIPEAAPVLRQTIFLVENASVTQQWPWLAEAVAALV